MGFARVERQLPDALLRPVWATTTMSVIGGAQNMLRIILILVTSMTFACSSDDQSSAPSGIGDAAPIEDFGQGDGANDSEDTGLRDASLDDASPTDMRMSDVGAFDMTLADADMGTMDGAIADMAALDASTRDAGMDDDSSVDMRFVDSTPPDMDVLDASTPDAAAPDMDMADAAAPDMDTPDAMAFDMDPQDASSPDVEVPDVGHPDMDPADAEVPVDLCEDGVLNGGELGVDCGGECPPCPIELIEVQPEVYPRALKNPMKGLTTNGVQQHEWASLNHVYIRWNELEDREADGIERIRLVTEAKFAGVAERNVKVIPRVYLHWSRDDQKYWPSDMVTDDYTSEQFQARLTRLVERLGQVWNNDPRIAFIELGIFGKWGEHHSPAPTPFMQELAAEAFSAAFPNKKISVRHAWREFQGYGFGEYWDSFSHYDQMWPHGQQVRAWDQASQQHLTNYIGGETAYDWGGWEIQPGTDPTDSVRDPFHRNFIINTIKWLHCTQLRWIHAYDVNDEMARAGAEEVHRAMGYRLLLERARFTPTPVGGQLRVELDIRNVGAAPFYYAWPVEIALVDLETRAPVWRERLPGVDIRTWVGGSGWPEPEWSPRDHWAQFSASNDWTNDPLEYGTEAPLHQIGHTFNVAVPDGRYLLTVAVLDPASQRPSLRFATRWYLEGGRHPVGLVGIGAERGGPLPDDYEYSDPWTDNSLNYVVE